MTKVIGFVEDDEIIRSNYQDLLESDGYKVVTFSSLKQSLLGFTEHNIDLALLDISLEDDQSGGLKLCKVLREQYPTLPIVFFTSHANIDFQSKGWRFGADDYVTKDTEIELVLLRIKALLNRYEIIKRDLVKTEKSPPATPTNIINNLEIDKQRFSAKWRNTSLNISLTQFWILTAIFEADGKVLNFDDLQKAANIVVEPNTISSHIKSIRKAFRNLDPSFNSIVTERSRGYRWLDKLV